MFHTPVVSGWRYAFVFLPRKSIDGDKITGHCMKRYVDGLAEYRRETPAEISERVSADAW